MSKGQALRALVNERLAAAAEDIIILFERTIAEYEEELCRSREENQRKQQILDTVLDPRVEEIRENLQNSLASPVGLKKEISETPGIKEEPKEKEQLLVPVTESSALYMKTEESSQPQQAPTELREETQEEDISSEPHFLSETEGQTDSDDWGPLLRYSEAQMEMYTVGDNSSQVPIRDRSSTLSLQNQPAPETSVNRTVLSATDWKKHQCPFCQKRFGNKQHLQRHIRVHTGEKPYTCAVCNKHFADPSVLRRHAQIHTSERPFTCAFCDKTFTRKHVFLRHMSNIHIT